MRSVLILCCAVVTVTVCTVAARADSVILRWVDTVSVQMRVGDQMFSTYDVAVEVALARMLAGDSLTTPPDRTERVKALGRLLFQRILLDAADRYAVASADLERVRLENDALIGRYGNGSTVALERITGIPTERLQWELRRRARVKAYVEDVVLPSVRISEEEMRTAFAESVTVWGGQSYEAVAPQLRKLMTYKAIRAELIDLKDRYLERRTVQVLDEDLNLRDVIDAWQDDSGDPLKPRSSGGLP